MHDNQKSSPSSLSVVIPVGPNDDTWREFLGDLTALHADSEIILVGASESPHDFELFVQLKNPGQSVRWIVGTGGRACLLNAGAREARNGHLWFLHADSRIEAATVVALVQGITGHPDALHYSELRFHDDEAMPMELNTVGVAIRSRILGMPFGDQGFCISRDIFERLGGFDETAPYGEDHLFVWKARQHGIELRSTGATISTSARGYREHGWVYSTARTMVLTWRQAVPQIVKLVKMKLGCGD